MNSKNISECILIVGYYKACASKENLCTCALLLEHISAHVPFLWCHKNIAFTARFVSLWSIPEERRESYFFRGWRLISLFISPLFFFLGITDSIFIVSPRVISFLEMSFLAASTKFKSNISAKNSASTMLLNEGITAVKVRRKTNRCSYLLFQTFLCYPIS